MILRNIFKTMRICTLNISQRAEGRFSTYFLLVVLIIFLVGNQPLHAQEKTYQLSNQAYYQVETIYNIKNIGTDKVTDLNLDISAGNEALTRNMPYAILLYSSSLPEPGEISRDSKGNQIARHSIASLNSGESNVIKTVQIFRAAEIALKIEPEKVEGYESVIRVISPYLSPSSGIESDNPLIMTKAKEIIAGEINPYLKAKKIFEFLNSHMRYANAGEPSNLGALSALQTGVGVCEDYADLMVALLRAAGVPARTVSGWMGNITGELITADETGLKSPGHMWLEYYLPGYGWVPSDPTYTYLYNGIPTVDYERLTGLKELRYATSSEEEDFPVSFSYYGSKVEVSYEIKVSRLNEQLFLAQRIVDYISDAVLLYIEDIPLILDVEPVIIESRTLVPLRGIFSVFGAEVNWDGAEEQVTVKTADKSIVLRIGSNIAQVNGQDIVLDTSPRLVNNRTMVPLRFISESIGIQVDWDFELRTINLEI